MEPSPTLRQQLAKVQAVAARTCCPLLEAAACMGRHAVLVHLLLAPSGEMAPAWSLQDRAGALHAAARHGHAQCVRAVLDASPSSVPELVRAVEAHEGSTALILAARGGHAACLEELLRHSPETQVAAVVYGNVNALLYASAAGHARCVGLLLRHSPDAQVATVTSDARMSPLMYAVFHGHADCARLLLRHSPLRQVGAKDAVGRSALLRATSESHVECVRLLLEHDPRRQCAGQALELAARQWHACQAPPQPEAAQHYWRCMELLLAKGAMLHAQDLPVAFEAMRRVVQDLAARARVPDMANEAAAGLVTEGSSRHGRQPSAKREAQLSRAERADGQEAGDADGSRQGLRAGGRAAAAAAETEPSRPAGAAAAAAGAEAPNA